ncbi:Ig-like domain-containing protein [Exiguobacterium sp. B2(2022)]|uniref:Ig-like domain-containing protein n=1 Tax=Exiguobacterium sp. B2(2022) TaxID=2992755 RepID=UPI00237B0BA6|nr:Ig-like domain-containing protein [Exiguobacterium sp. B2(2022)]MDE0564230.1 Ig-like domain-containing protein [Exiguobacterium sp. B2(2022)]
MKKWLAQLIIIILLVHSLPYSGLAVEDTEAPELISYTIESGEYTVGDEVSVRVEARDDSPQIPYVSFFLKKPITGAWQYVSMDHQGDGVYEGTLLIEDGMESGRYVMGFVNLVDAQSNSRTVYREKDDVQGFEVYGTNSDTTAPELISYTIESGEFTVGDEVSVRVEARDDSNQIPYVSFFLKKPITGAWQYVSMDHQGDGVYEGTLLIEDGMESGRYVMGFVNLVDAQSNSRTIYRNEEDTQGFILRYPSSDTVKPTFAKIDSATLELDEGDFQSFKIFASDDLKLKSVDATFVNEINETKTLSSTHVTSDGFNMELPRSAFPKEAATWKLQSLRIQDMNANETIVTEGLSFTVKTLAPITPVDARIVKSNESWSYTTVNQDIYIMPGATLTLGQGTVLNGNVYVGGRLRLTGGVNVKGQLRGTYFTFGYYTPSQDGMVVMSGSNSVYSMTATNQLYDTLPFRLESTPVFEQDGQVSVSGSFIPLSTLYLNGEQLQTKANGTFRVDLKTPEDRTLRFSMTDAYGKIHRWSYRVYKTDVPVVTVTLDSGIYLKGQTVGLTATDGTIHVTRNNQASVYEGPFTLNETVSLSAYAKDEIDRTSETVSRRYEVMTIDPVTNRDTSIQGTAEPGTHVTLTLGADASTVTTDETGRFVFDGLQLTNQSTFSIQATHGMLASDVWTKSIQDVIAPIVTGVSHDHFYAQPVSFTFNEGTATLNGNVVKSPVRIETDGTYELVVKDEANNQTTVRFTLDQQAPVLTGVPNGLTNQIVTPTFNEGVALLNGKSFTSGQSITTDGTYTLIVRDKAGHETKQSFKIDRTAPVVSNVQNGSLNRNITPVFGEGTATLNDKPFTSGTIVSEEGVYELVVKDEAGNVTKLTFTIDKTAVEVQGVTANGHYQTARPTFSEGTATLNDKPFTSGTVVSEEGVYELVVKDEAGNVTKVTFTIDKTAVEVQGVTADGYYQSARPTFSEGTATLNDKPFTSGTVVSEEGVYNLVVKDEAGNVTKVTFTIDKTAVEVQGVTADGYYQSVRPTFSEGTATLNDKPFVSGALVSEEGIYELVVKDKALNVTKVMFTVDKTAVEVQGVTADGHYQSVRPTFSEGTATLNDKTFTSGTVVSEEGVYELEVKDKAGNVTKITFTIDKTAVEVQGVTEEGTYPSAQPTFSEGEATLNGKPFTSGQVITTDGNYTLTVTDRAGNQTVVHFTIDATPPAVSGFTSGKVAYREVKPTFTEGTATLNGKPFLSGTTIATAGKYTLEITDEHGNKRSETFTIDRTSPVVTGVTHRQLTNKDLVIKFNEGTATLNGRRIANQTKVSTSGAYTLRVTDAAGNITQLTFTIDKKAPDRPTLLTLTNKSTRVTGKAEKGAMVYIYYNNRTYKAKASGTGVYRYDMKTTKVGATVSVRALDAAGNLSPLTSLRVLNTFRTFSVNSVRASQTYVTGKGNEGATVQAFVGTKAISKTAKVDSRGNYKLVIPRQKSGVTVTVKMKQSGYQDMKKMIKVTR